MQTANPQSALKTLVELPELVDNLLLLLSDKEKVVINKRFNTNGKGHFTLEQIGQEFSVTRERVRQIEKNALNKMKRNVFNTSLKSLHDHVLRLVRENGGLMKTQTLLDALSRELPDSSIDADRLDLSLALHETLDSIGNTINFHPHLRDRSLPEYSMKHASNQLINQMHKYGDVKSLAKVHNDLRPVFVDLDFDVTRIKSLIDIDKRITLLDDDFVGLLEWRHVHPRTLRDKILFVLRNEKKPQHFGAIAEKISGADFDGRPVNMQAVHNELIRHDNFVLIGRGIYALAEWGYEPGTVGEVVEKLLQDNGEMTQEDIVDAVLKRRQVKKITIVLSLKNNSKFERVGRRRYKLRA